MWGVEKDQDGSRTMSVLLVLGILFWVLALLAGLLQTLKRGQ